MGMTYPEQAFFLFALVLYFVKPSWLMLLWLISEPLLAPIIVLFSGVFDFVDQQKIVWGLWGLYNKLFLLIIIIEIVFRGAKLSFFNIKYMKHPVIILFVFLFFHGIVTHFSFLAITKSYLFVFYTLPPLLVLSLNRNTWPSLNQIFYVTIAIFVIELAWIPLNMQGIFAYSGRYQEILSGSSDSLLIVGSFTRSNMLADYIAIVYFFLTIDYFSRKSISLIVFVVVSVMVFTLLMHAGSRMPMVVTIINIILCVIVFERKHFAIILIGVFVVSGFVGVSSITGSSEQNDMSDAGLDRIVSGLTDFAKSKGKKGQDVSTVSLSTELIGKYFYTSPLWGHGNAYNDDDKAYKLSVAIDLSDLKSDATLAFYMVEYGLIGTLLLLYFYWSVIKSTAFYVPLSQRKQIVCLIFLFFVLFSVTERGIFNRNNFTFIYLYMFGLARYYKGSHFRGVNLVIKKDGNS